MKDQNKTKEQLIQELEATRQRITELEVTCAYKEKKQKQLLIAEREQRALAEALCQTGTALTSTFKRDEVLDRILEQIGRVVVYDAACIILFDGNRGQVFRWRGYSKFGASDFLASGIPNLTDIPVLQKIRDTHKALAVPNVSPGDEWINQSGKEWVKSYALVPIISRSKVIGLLNIDSKTPSFIGQHDAHTLQAFADQAAIALENSWLYDRARYEVARRVRSLKQERNFVSTILDTIETLVVVLDPQGRIIRFNGAYEKVTGFSAEEVRYRYLWELFLTPQEIEPFKEIIGQLAAGQYPIEHSSHLKARNGELRQIMWTNTVLRNSRGNVEYIIGTGLDVTEHKKTTAALHKNQQQHKQFTDHLPVGIYQTTQNGKLLDANPALAALFDYSSVDELLNTPTLAIYKNPVERHKLLKQYKESGIIQNEIKVRTKGGKPIWIRNTGRVALSETGEIDHIGGTIENITERKLAEKALKESEERFSHVLSSITDHVYVTETTGNGNRNVLYISPHIEDITGYPQAKFKADWRFMLTKVVHPNDRVIAGAHLARAMTGRSSEVEYRVIKADGSLIWIHDRIRAETRRASIINYGVVSDITKRKLAEEALAAEQERMAVTLRSINDGVIAVDANRRVVLANPVGRKYLAMLTTADVGSVLTNLGGIALDDILAVASEANNLFELELQESPKRIFEVAAQKTDTDQHIRGWVLIIRDVTEKRAIEESVHQQERLAAVGQLAAGIAHDFNNILTSMIGIAELSADLPDLPPIVTQDMKRISELGQQAARLTRQILDFGRKSISEKQPISLDDFVKETAKLLNRTISENIRIELDIASREFICNADPTQMQQILTNLAINAQDAMPGGGILTFRLARLTLPDNEPPPIPELTAGDWIALSISDTGTGITPEHQTHLFEPFFTTKEVGKGTGLGLAQVYGIVKQHEGFIEVNSQLNEGTTFTLYFPALPAQQEMALAFTKKETVPMGSGELILLVEDNPTVLSVTQLILEKSGYRVVTATNGQQALEIYDQHREKIQLVLTDITMPEMGGTALCKALHARDTNLKVVAMTGYPLNEGFEALSSEGFTNWLAKPLSLDKVARVIFEALK